VIKYVLQPGDSLYIPLYWFHLVYGKGDNLSFTDFYYSTLKKRIFSTVFLRSIKNC
jgi:oxalate decarboxylase/phosphoglucose isomerase-like protein (cupin superfamily)